MAGLMNMVSRFARGRGAAGRPTPGTRGAGAPGGMAGGTAPAGRRGGQAAMAEGLVRRFMRRGR